MSEYKYPYIPKDYYAPVMFACKMIRQNGYFNKAISTAARYYGVDENELEKHVRARQAAGQKGTAKGRKYHYYLVCGVSETERDPMPVIHEITVEKATSAQNAHKKYNEIDDRKSRQNYTGGIDSISFWHITVDDTKYNTEDDAHKALASMMKELKETGKSHGLAYLPYYGDGRTVLTFENWI